MNFYIIQDLWNGHVFTCPTAEARMWAILNSQMDECAFNIFRVGGSMCCLMLNEIT